MTAVARLQRLNTTDSDERSLFEIIKTVSFRRGKFTLASGIESDFYFNLKPTMMGEGRLLSAKIFLQRARAEHVDAVGGLEMGAVPIISNMGLLSDLDGKPLKTFFVRKKVKPHGTKELIEGLGPGETIKGIRVLVADDVATKGGSILDAITAVRDAGAHVDKALVLLDRQEGAAEKLKAHGVILMSVFRADQFKD